MGTQTGELFTHWCYSVTVTLLKMHDRVIRFDPYLEVTMHYAVLVQIANGLQHLLDHAAGVLLRVHAPVQYAVKELTA